MASSGKYRSEKDLLDRIAELEDRLSRLERTNQLSNAAVNSGNITIKGGGLYIRRPSDVAAVEGLIVVGSTVTFQGQEGMAISVDRSDSVAGGTFFFGSGEAVTGNTSLRVGTIEGSDPLFRFPTISIYDKSGNVLLADSTNGRFGFSDPILATTWYVESAFTTTTSGTFAKVATSEWYMYHPNLRVRLLVQNDGGNVSQVRLTERSTGKVLDFFDTPSGANQYVDLIIARSQTEFGDTPNGNIEFFDVEHKRVSGAGTCRTLVVSMAGIDLSWFEDF